jgi:hypothetical protein
MGGHATKWGVFAAHFWGAFTGRLDTAEPPFALPPPRPSKDLAAAELGRIEITLPDGTCVRVGSEVGLVALRRVMAAVRR